MKKYNVSREYQLQSKLLVPFNKKVFVMADFLLSYNSNELESDEDIDITTENIIVDECSIPLYIYTPKKFNTDKVLLYIHGGGFAYKGYFKHYRICRRYAIEGRCKVVYVDYRLLPKYPFPSAVNDCFSAYKWIIDNSDKLGVDTNKIIVGGDSAGGCLSCDVVISCNKEKVLLPRVLLLLYPTLDKRMNTKSMIEYDDAPIWEPRLSVKMWDMYLGDNEYISPSELDDVSFFPKTYIETAEFDCLRDEGIEFAKRLELSGVDVTLNETKGTIHGFDIRSCETTENAIKERLKMINSIEE